MKVNTLNEQFASVFNNDEDTSSIPDMGPSPHPTMDNIPGIQAPFKSAGTQGHGTR